MLHITNPFIPLAVGSFPHQHPEEALDLIFRYLPQIPLWPQLPQRDFRENMYIQYSNGMPSVIIDEERQRIYFDTSSSPEADLEEFYERILGEDLAQFAFPSAYASGFWAFVSSFKQYARGKELCVKGQVTGPFSFGLTVTDENNRPIIYHQAYYEAAVTALSLHAAWQAERLKELHPHVLMFIDEPYLASYGSAFVSVDRDLVVRSINEVIDRIHQAGALAGLHCCGNTDWSLVLETRLDLLNFDAYHFFDNLILYNSHLKDFLDRGGVMAWGIIPSSEEVLHTTLEELEAKLRGQVETLVKSGIEENRLKKGSLLSPACGLGSLSSPVAETALKKLEILAEKLARAF
jgi:methionine synthase II (cobalamin-independent)